MSLWSPEFLSQTIMQQSRRGSAICRRMGKKNINVTALHWKDRGTVIMSGQINIAIGSECAASNNADGNCVRFKFVQGTDTHWRLTAVLKSLVGELKGELHITVVSNIWLLVPFWTKKGTPIVWDSTAKNLGLQMKRFPRSGHCYLETELHRKITLVGQFWTPEAFSCPASRSSSEEWLQRCRIHTLHYMLWQLCSHFLPLIWFFH